MRAKSLACWPVALVTFLLHVPVWAACPAAICDCLGAARSFSATASDLLRIRHGAVLEDGYLYRLAAGIDGRSCARQAVAAGAPDAVTEIGDLILLAPVGEIAARFRSVRVYGYAAEPGVSITGDLVTAGGSIKRPELALVSGTTDTTGGHSSIASCQQAVSDAEQAANTLAGLAPTEPSLGNLLVKTGSSGPLVVSVGTGVSVLSATAIVVRPKREYGYAEGSELAVDMPVGATAVVINTPKLSVGSRCTISVTGPGANPASVVINVVGGRGVRVAKEAIVEPAILAAASTIGARPQAQVSNVFGRKVVARGANVMDLLGCPASPSGAFLDPATAVLD
jgi:hypothetical protein